VVSLVEDGVASDERGLHDRDVEEVEGAEERALSMSVEKFGGVEERRSGGGEAEARVAASS